jgi:S-(hydroxymethyl)glutathione dehydrogenase/alcohol dehydrogenase
MCEEREAVIARGGPSLRDHDGDEVRAFGALGTFAEQMLVHEHAVAKIRADMPLGVAALIGCAVTTGVGAVVRTAAVAPGSTVAVVGCGGIGLAVVQGARLVGASRVIAVDVSGEKLDRALGIGATDAVNARNVDAVEAVRELTGGGVDYSFEAIGTKATAEQCFAMLGPRGTATIIGMIPVTDKIEIAAWALLGGEQRIQGSMMGSNRFRVDMPWYCDLYLDGRLKLDEMVTAHRPLDEINEGYDVMRRGEGARTVIDFAI